MIVVKNENVLDAAEAVELSNLFSGAVVAHKAYLQTILPVCCAHNEYFQVLDELLYLQGAVDLAESVELLLCDPLHDVCRSRDVENSDSDVFYANYRVCVKSLSDLKI